MYFGKMFIIDYVVFELFFNYFFKMVEKLYDVIID